MNEESEPYTGPIFEVGDVVRLNSGGPLMTIITATDGDGDVECRWFRSTEGINAIVDEAYFNGHCLTKIAK